MLSKEDAQGVQFLHNDAVVVSLDIINFDVYCILVDNESLTIVLFYDTFFKIGFTLDQLRRLDSSLVNFFGNAIPMKGVIMLLVITSQMPRQATMQLSFLVNRILLDHNAILE